MNISLKLCIVFHIHFTHGITFIFSNNLQGNGRDEGSGKLSCLRNLDNYNSWMALAKQLATSKGIQVRIRVSRCVTDL